MAMTARGPRISVNKLGEYMVASFVRRRGIIKNQKKPPTPMSARYTGLTAPVLEFLVKRDITPLRAAAARLSQEKGTTTWKESDRQATIKALVAVEQLADQILLPNLTFAEPPSRPRKLVISGVDVSVQPHAYVYGTKAGKEVFGALRFHFIQDEESSLDKRGGDYVATVLHRWCMENPWMSRLPNPTFSMAIDVFTGTVTTGPAKDTKRMENIEAACEEIALKWPTA